MPDCRSNLTKKQFDLIRPDLENFRKRTRPRTVELYNDFNAVLYVLRTGLQWVQVPNDFPKWPMVVNCQIKCNFLPKKNSDGVFQPKTLRGRLFS